MGTVWTPETGTPVTALARPRRLSAPRGDAPGSTRLVGAQRLRDPCSAPHAPFSLLTPGGRGRCSLRGGEVNPRTSWGEGARGISTVFPAAPSVGRCWECPGVFRDRGGGGEVLGDSFSSTSHDPLARPEASEAPCWPPPPPAAASGLRWVGGFAWAEDFRVWGLPHSRSRLLPSSLGCVG